MRQLSRLTVAHPMLLAFPNRRPSYLLSHMHHSRHLHLVLRSIQGKMRRFLHHRAQRVHRTVLPHHLKHVFRHRLSPDNRLGLHLISNQLLVPAHIHHPIRLPSNLVRQVGHTLEQLLHQVLAEAYHRLLAYTFVPCHLLATPCRRPQHPHPGHMHLHPARQYIADFLSQDHIHHQNRRKGSMHLPLCKGNPALDLDLLSRLWVKHSQCESHHPLIPTRHKDTLELAQALLLHQHGWPHCVALLHPNTMSVVLLHPLH